MYGLTHASLHAEEITDDYQICLGCLPDHIFSHIAAAVDPPEVVVNLTPRPGIFQRGDNKGGTTVFNSNRQSLQFDAVRVVRQEAVGMEDACGDYIKDKWCFVAVKTKVGQKRGVDPKPGQRTVKSKLPSGSTFDGSVQAMGFRFKSDELVVPMRLSSFNAGELRNVIYLLTDGPKKVRAIPEEYVVRQIPGERLYKNITQLLPLRVIGGVVSEIPAYRRKTLPKERDPEPKNGAAKDLFAGDLLAVSSKRLSLPHEEKEKELLRIGERFGLRGAQIDKLNTGALADERAKTVKQALEDLKGMTLTVIDGDFPREVLARRNLTFGQYRMPARRNTAEFYDAKQKQPAGKKQGVLKLGRLNLPGESGNREGRTQTGHVAESARAWLVLGLALAIVGLLFVVRRKS